MQAHFAMRQHPSSIPSFMSVFQDDARPTTVEQGQQQSQHGVTGTQSQLMVNSPMQSTFGNISRPFHIFHQPRNSTSTSASESPDSSPTTTISTGDSSSVAESSPSTSPETPISSNISPLCHMMDNQSFQPPERIKINPIQGTFFEMQRPTTPGKKPRNLKGLAVNTAPAGRPLGRAVSYNSSSVDQLNAPGLAGISSPVFVKPPTPPRRKMSSLGLSIMTPANNSNNLPRIAIPPTPSIARPNMLSLRQFQSSPALATFPSETTPASPPRSNVSAQRAKAMGFADVVHEEDEEDEPNFDIPQSQEEKPESYPQGPIKIYESGIDLYFEPAADVASRYDVIFNVASEVKNPFRGSDAVQPTPSLNKDLGIVAVPYQSTSPDTPKAALLNSIAAGAGSMEPEYIHIPWEHNTDIVRDLCILVKIMDQKIQEGKRILVHCQCGVSRSASLIVAYGLYKNPELSVQDAYDAVKKRSKWIAPNMSLIMQLQEFRTKVLTTTAIDRSSGFTDDFVGPSAVLNDILSPVKTTFGDALPFTAPTSFFPSQPPVLAPISTFARKSTPELQSVPVKSAPQEPKAFTRALPFRRDWETSPKKAEFDFSTPSSLSMGTPSREDSITPQPIAIAAPLTVVSESTETTIHNNGQAALARPVTPPRRTEFQVPAKRKTPNFSRQLPLRRDWSAPEDNSTTSPDHTFLELTPQETLLSPRSETFHMTPVAPQVGPAQTGDSFGILSPTRTEFPTNPFNTFLPSGSIERQEPQPLALASPPLPRSQPDTTPLATSLARNIPGPVDFSSIPLPSAEPAPHASLLQLPRRLKSKFSSPNLQQQLRLRKMQSSLENSIQQAQAANNQPRAFDDLDALMSPRATEFTVNPWNTMRPSPEPGQAGESDGQSNMSSSQETIVPVTTAPPAPIEISKEDPRSPPLHGVAPIVRNIDEVL